MYQKEKQLVPILRQLLRHHKSCLLDVSLEASESLLFPLLGIVEVKLDDRDSGVTLHLLDDCGQSGLANLFQIGQLASTEHHLREDKEIGMISGGLLHIA